MGGGVLQKRCGKMRNGIGEKRDEEGKGGGGRQGRWVRR